MNTDNLHPIELLPWYVNGTLKNSELAQVKSHLESCTLCQQEVDFLRTMQQQVRDEQVDGPGEFAFKRLMSDIKKENSVQNKKRPWWEPVLAVAAMLVIIIQTSVIIMDPEEDPITLLGKNQADIKVMFKPTANIATIGKALKSVNAKIHSGPDQDNFYILDIRKLNIKQHPDKIKAIVVKLKKQKHLFDYVDTE